MPSDFPALAVRGVVTRWCPLNEGTPHDKSTPPLPEDRPLLLGIRDAARLLGISREHRSKSRRGRHDRDHPNRPAAYGAAGRVGAPRPTPRGGQHDRAPIAAALAALLNGTTGAWTGTTTDLSAALTDDLPAELAGLDPSKFSATLRSAAPALAAAGIAVEPPAGGGRNGRVWTISRADTVADDGYDVAASTVPRGALGHPAA